MVAVRRLPERLNGLVTDESLIIVVDRDRAVFFAGDARCVFACRDARVFVAARDIHTVAAERARICTAGPLQAYDDTQIIAMPGCEAHVHMDCKFIARPGAVVYMYDQASGCALSGSTIVIDPSARNEPRLCGHKIRVIDQRRAVTLPVFVI